jgi:exonuclease I
MERKGDLISNIRYKKETEVVTFQGKEITLENLSPVFTPDQEAAKRRELEQQLYEVFRKYADKRQSEEAGA